MTTDIKERLQAWLQVRKDLDTAMDEAPHKNTILVEETIAYIEQQQIEIDTLRHGLRLANDARSDLEAKLSAQTAETMTAQELANRIRNGERWKLAKTEQPSLSDERIDEIAYSITTKGLVTWWRLFAREIERISAPRQDSDKEPLVWESTTPCYTRFVSEARYQKFSPEVRAWYRPVCQKCTGATK